MSNRGQKWAETRNDQGRELTKNCTSSCSLHAMMSSSGSEKRNFPEQENFIRLLSNGVNYSFQLFFKEKYRQSFIALCYCSLITIAAFGFVPCSIISKLFRSFFTFSENNRKGVCSQLLLTFLLREGCQLSEGDNGT